MSHAVTGVVKRCQALPVRDVHAARSCLARVSAPRLDQLEPSQPDELPATRARYTAGAFAPPATQVALRDKSRAPSSGPRPVQHATQLPAGDGPLQRNTPLTDEQLEEFSSSVLTSSSSIWNAETRNVPASTSDNNNTSADEVLSALKGKATASVVAALKSLTKQGEYDTVVRVLQGCSKSTVEAVFRRWHYDSFITEVALSLRVKPAVQLLKLALPHAKRPAKLVTSVLQACAKCRDLDAGLTVVDLARRSGCTVDVQMLTTLMKVCKSVGNVDKAYRIFLELRSARYTIDSHVYGTLIATCAEAMKRDLTVVHERKDQYVLLERAFQYVADAEAAGVALQAPVWNALMVCAGRSGELNRAFEVLGMMQQRGVQAGAPTYGSLIEACVCARQPEKALRVYEVAMQRGFTTEVKIYTQALSACMLPIPHAWERALDIYSALQRCAVRPDKKFFACLMAVAGRCGRLDTAFEVLSEMAAEGIRPSGTSVSAIMHACLNRGNVGLARRVYDLCARQGVFPVQSQFNRLMDVYAMEFRFGEVVSLLSDMVAAGRRPNLNTYRILINACALTDQAGLAFQVFALLHANKIQILQLKFAQTIYYMLIKACYNQIRYLWTPGGYPPHLAAAHAAGVAAAAAVADAQPTHASEAGQAGEAGQAAEASDGANTTTGSSSSTQQPQQQSHSQQQQNQEQPNSPQPGSSQHAHNAAPHNHQHHQHQHHQPLGLAMPADRRQEAQRVLEVLGGHKLRRGGGGGSSGGGGLGGGSSSSGSGSSTSSSSSSHRSSPFDGRPDEVDWSSHALSAFHHMMSRGFRPTLELLDILLNCMRAKMLPPEDPNPGLAAAAAAGVPGGLGAAQGAAAAAAAAAAASHLSPFIALRSRMDVFEVAFEPRAFVVLEEAISRGLLPSYDPDKPLVMDMRRMPPVVAEVYVLHMLFNLERRAARRWAEAEAAAESAASAAGGGGGGAGGSSAVAAAAAAARRASYYHPITLLVPPFDPDLVKWPSYVERVVNRYTASMPPDAAAKLRRRNDRRRARARRLRTETSTASAASAATATAPAHADGTNVEGMYGRPGASAVRSYYDEELEAALSGDEDEDEAARDPWRYEDEEGWEGSEDEEASERGSDASGGGGYKADTTTGLAVAATLQRMKVWMDMDYVGGSITVVPVEVARWLKRRRQAAEAAATVAEAAARRGGDGRRSAAAASTDTRPMGPPHHHAVGGAMAMGMAGMVGARLMGRGGPMGRPGVAPVEQQARNIRLGLMGPAAPAGSMGGGGGFGPPGSVPPHQHSPHSRQPFPQQQHQSQHAQHAQQQHGRGNGVGAAGGSTGGEGSSSGSSGSHDSGAVSRTVRPAGRHTASPPAPLHPSSLGGDPQRPGSAPSTAGSREVREASSRAATTGQAAAAAADGEDGTPHAPPTPPPSRPAVQRQRRSSSSSSASSPMSAARSPFANNVTPPSGPVASRHQHPPAQQRYPSALHEPSSGSSNGGSMDDSESSRVPTRHRSSSTSSPPGPSPQRLQLAARPRPRPSIPPQATQPHAQAAELSIAPGLPVQLPPLGSGEALAAVSGEGGDADAGAAEAAAGAAAVQAVSSVANA
ncbi:hypothetical protein Agub_g14618 [Astrephomene gubernaculifera]|uniref:Pentatricopeptide repeat-containing protein-mitochondrial domain-containing protein n=1 Tax=Astrephomene gubernaculifera TaxID=47775 RepID=A0AAD3E1S1_9CHLO|nr:hypothetical protein Agub_g14618 [Astrephomene gubernaculifera]